jgi:hypothetical protein
MEMPDFEGPRIRGRVMPATLCPFCVSRLSRIKSSQYKLTEKHATRQCFMAQGGYSRPHILRRRVVAAVREPASPGRTDMLLGLAEDLITMQTADPFSDPSGSSARSTRDS